MTHFVRILLNRFICGLLFCLTGNVLLAASIPYQEALDNAAIVQDRLDDVGRRALPLGNGDLNALLWDRDGVLCLRVTKNDLWDARIDTSNDPALLKIDVRNRIWSDGTNRVSSWSDHPYPQPRAAAVIRIGSPVTKNSITNAQLDLRRAVVVANTTSVRVLADRNVILIESQAPVSLEEVQARQLPPAIFGETNGVQWLHMTMPGDIDYKGMEYALAVVTQGERKAVSMVTSFDTTNPVLDTAIRLAQQGFESDAISRHEAVWQKFWSAAGVELEDKFFQNAWYRNLYYMRCFCRSGTTLPIMLYAGMATDEARWHGAPTLNYNFEQVFWPMFVCNQLDAAEPYIRFIQNYAPRGRWLAKKTYGVEGLFLPLNIFGPENLVSPELAKSRNARQICYVPWTYTLGCTGWGLQNLWLRYKYAPDRKYLESIYPLFRDGAEFYANILEQCRDGELGPSYNPEHGAFGTFNNPVDIAYFRFLLSTAADAANILGRDAKLAERWRGQLARVPDYETTPLNGEPIIADWKGATVDSVKQHNIVSPIVPIFPADQVTWFSSHAEKEIFGRTLRWIKFRDDNAHIMVNVERARLSMPEAYTESRKHFSNILTPNGLFAAWPGHGFFLAESWAFAGLASELLLQSVGDIIRVFPAWPKDKDASFTDLRAQGGFLVGAEQKAGLVTNLRMTSTVGGFARLLNPWPGLKPTVFNLTTGNSVSNVTCMSNVLTIPTVSGMSYYVGFPGGIKPGEPWLDNRGKHIQAHGGGILKSGENYYWFGEDRSAEFDWHDGHVACYISTNLIDWSFCRDVLNLNATADFGGQTVVERPKVYHNAKTGKFVMYFHMDNAHYHLASVGVAVSDTVDGDYKLIKYFRPLGHDSRDIGQFIDDDGAAYLISEDRPNGFHIYQLSEDYLDIAKDVCLVPEHLEAGAIVHYGGIYYFVGSHLSGWTANPNVYATSRSLAGPWSEFRDIAPPEKNTYGSQSTMLLKIVGSKTNAVIFMGDIWRHPKLANSRYLWMPLEIDDGKMWLPGPKPWQLDVQTGEVSFLQPNNNAKDADHSNPTAVPSADGNHNWPTK